MALNTFDVLDDTDESRKAIERAFDADGSGPNRRPPDTGCGHRLVGGSAPPTGR
jgi:hypothetical protein